MIITILALQFRNSTDRREIEAEEGVRMSETGLSHFRSIDEKEKINSFYSVQLAERTHSLFELMKDICFLIQVCMGVSSLDCRKKYTALFLNLPGDPAKFVTSAFLHSFRAPNSGGPRHHINTENKKIHGSSLSRINSTENSSNNNNNNNNININSNINIIIIIIIIVVVTVFCGIYSTQT